MHINTHRIRLLPFIEADAYTHMSIDESVFISRQEGIVPDTIRFYSWEPKAVSLGYFQSAEKELDLRYVRNKGIDIVRRMTGGGAVFHDMEITYSVFLSETFLGDDNGLLESYQKICQGIIKGLNILGLNAIFSPINDVIAGGKKISGNAQTRANGMIMQHGTILLGLDIEEMFSVLKVPDEKMKDKMIKDVKERVTSLSDMGITDKKMILDSLIKGFSKTLASQFFQETLTPDEITLAERLRNEKYCKKTWTFRR